MNKLNIRGGWSKRLQKVLDSVYFKELIQFIKDERNAYTVYPKSEVTFEAFNQCEFDKVKVVILGQDPYHGANQANGLAFSVQPKVKIPPSLKNIFKELVNDVACDYPKHGDLSSWAQQGVLLLNTVLTVRDSQPASHQNKGWEIFTNATLKALQERPNIVYILWGKFAQQKKMLIDSSQNLILEAPHPSPLSAHRGFFGSKPFSKTNSYLTQKGLKPIEWPIS